VFLPCLCRDLRWDGDGLLDAAGRRVLRRGEDLGAAAVEFHRLGPVGAADLARGGGAAGPVVAVGVIGGEAAEFVPGELGGPGVVRCDVVYGGVAGQRPEFQQRAGVCGQ
jgi:hypothetical protein